MLTTIRVNVALTDGFSMDTEGALQVKHGPFYNILIWIKIEEVTDLVLPDVFTLLAYKLEI